MGDNLRAMRRLVWMVVGACLVWPASALAQSPTRGLRAERFDVALTLLADGSVDVRETVLFRFTEKKFTRVDREIPIRRFDGVIDVRASLDGRPLTADGKAERVRIRKGRDTLRVTWTFPDTLDQTRAFTLEYRAMGALSVANGRAMMDWIVLPSRHRYEIDEARVEWRVPATAVRVEPTTVDDVRWTSSAMSDGWAATRHAVAIDETVKLADTFDAATLALSVPAWQANAYLARQMAPAFLVAAVTLLVIGAGVVGMTWFRYHVPARESGSVEPAAADAWPPAIGTALVRGSVGVGLAQMQATLLDLARRGVLQIAESTQNRKHFDIVMQRSGRAKQPELRPHEQVITDTLWLHMKDGRVDLRAAWRQLTRALPVFRRSVLTEIQDAGLVDAERRWAARGMRITGVAVLLMGMAGFIIFRFYFGHLGDVPLVVPGAVVLSGLAFVIAGGVMSVLSETGAAAAAQWRARRTWITLASKNRSETMSAADVARWFPVSAGFGLAHPVLKASKGSLGQGAAAFEWLGPVSHPDAALTVILASTASASYGGNGGGGGAGGGSSSAS